MSGDGAGAGFSAHPDKLGDAGDQLIAASTDVGSVKDALGKLGMSGEDTFGEYGAGDAAKAFWTAWQDELGVNVDALNDLGGKVHTTAANYSTTDHGVGQQYQQQGA
ncbi:type VII secretion target [Streptomyces sp. NRRL S-350]|uniref:type VII secretion target n=1 Tax=Streptomyces sp. NRRL S-350 TaxID=1463902 RepID=UPI0004BED24B|nr:type VII secretion target [Streptomyces sp. NRRL S-350]